MQNFPLWPHFFFQMEIEKVEEISAEVKPVYFQFFQPCPLHYLFRQTTTLRKTVYYSRPNQGDQRIFTTD